MKALASILLSLLLLATAGWAAAADLGAIDAPPWKLPD